MLSAFSISFISTASAGASAGRGWSVITGAADLGHSSEFNHKFWRDFRKAVKTANPEALILAEHYGDPKDWLEKGDQWDTVMNYDAFMEPLSWFVPFLR
jgi:alpha-glucosidase